MKRMRERKQKKKKNFYEQRQRQRKDKETDTNDTQREYVNRTLGFYVRVWFDVRSTCVFLVFLLSTLLVSGRQAGRQVLFIMSYGLFFLFLFFSLVFIFISYPKFVRSEQTGEQLHQTNK